MKVGGPRGLFIKTPAPQIVEILALAAPDFAVLDAEHAPFDRAMLDLMLLAGRAAGLPLLVRVPDAAGSTVAAALDLGAAGVVVPHVGSVEMAQTVVASARFRGGTRGYSSAPRHGAYGTRGMKDLIDAADAIQVLLQIEDPDAAANANAILEVNGVDGIVVGRADLAVAMGEYDAGSAAVDEIVRAIFASIEGSRKIKGVVVSSEAERSHYAQLGANWFIMGNDQSLLRTAAHQLLSA
jgi:2-keto-3-deoxy-L-rhamnonate aldolase RhmA